MSNFNKISIEIINQCYTLEHYKMTNPLLPSVEMGYIIHLANPKYDKRKKMCINQLKKYHPVENCIMVLNKGYKNCKKDSFITKPYQDLNDVYYFIFNHAKKNNYKIILIFEDDFFFDNKILNKNIYTDIDNFIKNKNNYYIYSLGGRMYPNNPLYAISNLFNKHIRVRNTTSSHAIIYSDLYINEILDNVKQQDMGHCDQMFKHYKSYMYYEPICWQLSEVTENSIEWDKNGSTTTNKNHKMTHVSRFGYKIDYDLQVTNTITVFTTFLLIILLVILLNIIRTKKN